MSGILAEFLFRARGGPRKVARWLTDRISDKYRDRKFGIASSARRSASDLGFTSPEYVEYQAVSYDDMEELLALLSPNAEDVFLDLGCGMGRAVCMAAMYPMRAVIGVEISAELCRLAQENVTKMAARFKCRDVRIVQSAAEQYAIPPEVSIVYLFNPFSGETLRRVLDNIRSARHRMRVVFYGTLSSETFEAEAARCAWLRMDSRHVLASGIVVLVYWSV